MYDWKDTTPYSRGKERIPTMWTLQRDFVTITITSRHIYNPDFWTMHCHALNMDTVNIGLSSDTPKETAQLSALNMASSKAREIARLLTKESE